METLISLGKSRRKLHLKHSKNYEKRWETPKTPKFDDNLPGRCKKGRGERRKHNREKGEFAEMNKNRVLVEGVPFITRHAGFM